LATDDQPGLQILKSKDEWIDVKPPPMGTFIVNLSDMLERWTNGMFKSTVHRVVSSGNAERYSVAFFFEPHFDTVIRCIDKCLKEGEKPKYAETTCGGHLLEKITQTHADFES
jgi:isopenicillin N synthase-like dioxygenase